MSRPNPIVLTLVLLVFLIGYGGLPFVKAGLFIDTHDADTYHFLDIVFRMVAGHRQHIDYQTPLGILAFLPISLGVEQGLSVARAFIVAQFALGLVLLPLIVYAGWTRLSHWQAIAFGLVVLGLVVTLSYGAAVGGVSVSMHYNRWSWAIAFVALLLAVCPKQADQKPRAAFEGAIIGVLSAALLLIKVTYFVTMVPVMVVAMLARRDVKGVIWALIMGSIVLGAVTAIYGFAFWSGYVSELLNVSQSVIRPFVGATFSDILTAPEHISATLIGLAAVMFVRRMDVFPSGAAFLLMIPGFIYIAYQNFGNTPIWLLFVAIAILTFRPNAGEAQVGKLDLRMAMNATSAAAVLVILPALYATALSPIKLLAADEARFLPMIDAPAHQDLFIRRDRAHTPSAQVELDQSIDVWAPFGEDIGRAAVPEVAGIAFPTCELLAGSRAHLTAISADLESAGIPEGSQFFTAGVLSTFWLYGPFEPLQNGAPWYYGGLSGIENADYVLISKCPFVARIRDVIIGELLEADISLSVVRDNALYALFEIN